MLEIGETLLVRPGKLIGFDRSCNAQIVSLQLCHQKFRQRRHGNFLAFQFFDELLPQHAGIPLFEITREIQVLGCDPLNRLSKLTCPAYRLQQGVETLGKECQACNPRIEMPFHRRRVQFLEPCVDHVGRGGLTIQQDMGRLAGRDHLDELIHLASLAHVDRTRDFGESRQGIVFGVTVEDNDL